MSFPFKKTRWIKANSSSLDLIALGAFLRLSLPRSIPLDSIYWKKRPRRFWLFSECLAWPLGRWPQRQTQWGEGLKKKGGPPRPLRRCRLMKNPTEEKGEKKEEENSSPMGLRLLSPGWLLCWALLILMSSLIRFNLTAPNWSTGIFSFSYFLYLPPPPSTTYGVTHIDFCCAI